MEIPEDFDPSRPAFQGRLRSLEPTRHRSISYLWHPISDP